MSDAIDGARAARPSPGRAGALGASIWRSLAGAITDTYRRQAYPLGYCPGLDGMRALVTLAVILFHVRRAWTPGGFVALEGFFVLSGYFITGLLLRERARAGRYRVRDFYRRRAARIFPPLLAMLAFVALAAWFGLAVAAPERIAAALGYVLLDRWWARIGPPVDDHLGHLWSIAIEMQFYIVWPWVMLVLLRLFGTGKRLVASILALAAACWAWRAWLCWNGTAWSLLYTDSLCRADALLIGSALAAAFPCVRALDRAAVARWAPLAAWGLLAVFAFDLVALRPSARWYYYFGSVLCGALPAAVAVTILRQSGGTVLHRIFERPVLVFLGHIFYALYLWHYPIIAITDENGLPRTPIGLPLTLLAAVLSYLLIERHFMRRNVDARARAA